MDKFLSILIGIALLVLAFFAFNNYIYQEKQADPAANLPTERKTKIIPVFSVTPISHASAVLQWDNAIIYTDPTGGPQAYEGQEPADIILITDIHGDHYSPETLNAVLGEATLIAPQAVIDMMPDNLSSRAQALANGETTTVLDFDITGVPMYNLPESDDARHTKGRGNGYIIERDGYRVYVAGDTAATPEMRALTDIDIAFVPMNPPFTMTVEEAAEGVLDFKPRQVYPYHYRGQEGLADVEQFKNLVDAGNEDIEVVLLNWYPE